MLLFKNNEEKNAITILVVDDENLNFFSIAALLKTRMIRPLSALNTVEAMAVLNLHPEINAVIMDIMMPGIDGIETTKRIRNDDRFAHLPIFVATADTRDSIRQKAVSAGATEFFTKPLDFDALMVALKQHIPGYTEIINNGH